MKHILLSFVFCNIIVCANSQSQEKLKKTISQVMKIKIGIWLQANSHRVLLSRARTETTI